MSAGSRDQSEDRSDTDRNTRRQLRISLPRGEVVVIMKLFLSYGHDHNTPIVLRIKRDLETAGHVVWIDSSEIKAGDDWRRSIVDGLSNSDWTLGFLSRHSVRNPGVCLDELAIALHVKGGAISTVLVEAETAVEPPVSVTHVQWLDMHDWSMRLADNGEAGEGWYRSKLDEILALLANPKTQRFAGEIEDLDRRLQPISQEADIGALVDGFVGREWLRSKLNSWRKNDQKLAAFLDKRCAGNRKKRLRGLARPSGEGQRHCYQPMPLQCRRATQSGTRSSNDRIPDGLPVARLPQRVARSSAKARSGSQRT